MLNLSLKYKPSPRQLNRLKPKPTKMQKERNKSTMSTRKRSRNSESSGSQDSSSSTFIHDYLEETDFDNTYPGIICLNDGLTRKEIKQLKQLIESEDKNLTNGEEHWYDIYESIDILDTLVHHELKPAVQSLKEDSAEFTKIYNEQHKKLMTIKKLLQKAFKTN